MNASENNHHARADPRKRCSSFWELYQEAVRQAESKYRLPTTHIAHDVKHTHIKNKVVRKLAARANLK
jgi:hypothetical protein